MIKINITPRQMEMFIGRMLRVGVCTACAIAIVGGILYIVQKGGTQVDFAEFTSSMAVESIGDVIRGVLALDAISVIQLSLLILIATPIMRVAVSVIAFAIEKDLLYVIITLAVLSIIIFNIFNG